MSNLSQDYWEKQGPCYTEPDDESVDNDDEGILNAFIATVNPTKGIVEEIDEEEELAETKFEKMDEQDDIHTAYAKLYKVSEKHEKMYRLPTKKFMKNANGKGFDKERRQSSSSQFKGQDKGKKDAKEGG